MKIVQLKTKGWTDIIDITDQIQAEIKTQHWQTGVVNLFVVGSTAALTTIEGDKNLYDDLKETLEKIAPYQKNWQHHQTWGDDNGAAHLRASLIGPSLTIPIINGRLFLGTWQRIVLIDFDTRPRNRDLVLSFIK